MWLAGKLIGCKQEAFLFAIKKSNQLPVHGQRNGLPRCRCQAGLSMALVDDFAGAVFALATLRSDPQLELDVVKPLALAGVQSNLFLGHPVANTNNHGESVVANF